MTIINNRRNVIVDDEDADYEGGEAVAIADDDSETYGRVRTTIIATDDADEDDDTPDDEEEVATVVVDDPDAVDEEWQIRRAAAVRTVLPELDGPSARDIEREERDWADVDTSDNADALDDPVRMYLREIGRVDLLTSADERRLARELEGLNHLLKLEEELAESARAAAEESAVDFGIPVERVTLDTAAWEAVMVLLARIANAAPLVRSLARYLELDQCMSLDEVKTSPALRAAIDAEVAPAMVEQAARRSGHRHRHRLSAYRAVVAGHLGVAPRHRERGHGIRARVGRVASRGRGRMLRAGAGFGRPAPLCGGRQVLTAAPVATVARPEAQ